MKSILRWMLMARARSVKNTQAPLRTHSRTTSLPAYSRLICSPSSFTRWRICSSVMRTSAMSLFMNSVPQFFMVFVSLLKDDM